MQSSLSTPSGERGSARNNKGSALTEMGPALLILLTMIFFPMLDVMGMAASYCSCVYLNSTQVKEASVISASDATSVSGQVQKGCVDAWRQIRENDGLSKDGRELSRRNNRHNNKNSGQDCQGIDHGKLQTFPDRTVVDASPRTFCASNFHY